MAKVAKIAAAVVGVVAIVATGGLGAPLAGAVTGFLGVGAGTLTAIGAGLSIAGALLSKPPSIPSSQGDRLNLTIDPQAPRKSVYGNTALPTDVRYQEWFGTNQERCGLIVAHAGHRIQGVDAIWLNDELAWTATGGTQGRFINYFWVRQVVPEGSPSTIANVAPGSRWNALCRLTGCAYSHLEFKVTGNSSKVESPFSSGIPQRITVIGKGSPVYDPRRDSTVAGGSGPMRANDQSTWRYIADDGASVGDNVALQILREKLGWRITNPATGEKKLSVGLGLPAKRIDFESYIIAANLCDETVTLAAGGTERRYVAAATLSEGDDPTTRLNMLCAACCGRITERSGKLGLAIAHNDLASIAADDGLNDDDLVGPFVWQPDPAITDVPNIVRGRYTDPSPNSLYQALPYPDLSLASVDGIDRVLPLDLSAVQSPSQAQRVAAQALMRRQYDRTFQATFDIRAWKYRIGDPLPFTLAALGFSRKPFRVVDQQYAAGGKCAMTLRVEDPAIYPLGGADRPAVQAAAPNVYNTSNNPLILAVQDAQQTADGAFTRANAAIAAVAGLGDDGILSRDEKTRILIPKNEELTNQWALLDAQAVLSPNVPAVVSARATAAQAWANWLAYRDSLSPAWNNVALDTFVTRATFTGVLTDLRYAFDRLLQALQSSIAGVPAGQIADAVKDHNGNVVPARDQFAAVKAQIDLEVGEARADAAKAQSDLAAEVERARGAEDTITANLAAIESTAEHASAAVSDEAIVRARDDVALGDRISVTEAQLAGDRDSTLKARIAAEETARADAVSAIASRASSLEATASASATGVALNPNFALWPDSEAYPPKWGPWGMENGGRISRAATNPVRGSAYAAYLQNEQSGVPWGILQTIWMSPGKWVIEAVVAPDAGSPSLSGAGVTLSGVTNLDFLGDPDTNGSVGNIGGVRSWSKMVDWAQQGVVNLHAMGGWDGFGRPIDAKYIRWFYLNVRPATDGEIKAGKALVDAGSALARIALEESTRVQKDDALSSRISTTEAQLAGTQGSTLRSLISDEEIARATQDTALASRTSVLEAGVTVDETAINPNSTFTYWPDPSQPPASWGWWDASAGIARVSGVNGRPYAMRFTPQANQNSGVYCGAYDAAFGAFVIEFTGRATEWQGAGVLAYFLDENGGLIEARPISAAVEPDTSGYASADGGGGVYTRTWSVFYKTNINGGIRRVQLYAMANWDGFGERHAKVVDFDRVRIRPATAAEIAGQRADASVGNALARVAVNEGAIADLKNRTAAYWEVAAVAGDNRAKLRVHADANGGAGVDIEGDVRIAGNLLVTGSVDTGQMAPNAVSNAVSSVVYSALITNAGPTNSEVRQDFGETSIYYTGGRLRVDCQFESYVSQDATGYGGARARLMMRRADGQVYAISRDIIIQDNQRNPYVTFVLTQTSVGALSVWAEFALYKTGGTKAQYAIDYLQIMLEETKR